MPDVTCLRKNFRVKTSRLFDTIHIDASQLEDALHDDLKANTNPAVQEYIQLLLRQMTYIQPQKIW